MSTEHDNTPTLREVSIVLENLALRHSELSETLKTVSGVLNQTSRTLEGIMNRLEGMENRASDRRIFEDKRHEDIERRLTELTIVLIGDSRSETPGMATRVDRIEQSMLRTAKIQNYILGGGLLAAISTGLTLIDILGKLSKAHTP